MWKTVRPRTGASSDGLARLDAAHQHAVRPDPQEHVEIPNVHDVFYFRNSLIDEYDAFSRSF